MYLNKYLRSFFAIYFTKSQPTTPIFKVCQKLQQFIKARVQKQQFQKSFSNYQTYIDQVLNDNINKEGKIKLFDLVTTIHQTYKLQSKKILKIQNRLASQIFQFQKQQNIQLKISLLCMLQRYNKPKSLALFKQMKRQIVQKIRKISIPTILKLNQFLYNLSIDDSLIRQTSIQILFNQIQLLKGHQIRILLLSFSFGKKYINKQFLGRVGKRLYLLFKTGGLDDTEISGVIASLSQIQANLHSRSIYLQQLDPLYEVVFSSLFSSINQYQDKIINRLTSAIRRSKYFDQGIMRKLIHVAMRRKIQEFQNQIQNVNRGTKYIKLTTFLNIVHATAVFNYNLPQFKVYVFEILKLIMQKQSVNFKPVYNPQTKLLSEKLVSKKIQKTKQNFLSDNIFSKLLWSICVLYNRTQVSFLYPLIQKYILNIANPSSSHAMNFYYCYLYIRSTCPLINQMRDRIHEMLAQYQLQTHTSNSQMQIYYTLIDCGVPCLPEYNLNNIICDIMIPQWKQLKNIIIQLHGFRHFCRNVKRLTGSNVLKKKIIQSQMYSIYYISLDQWLITQNKKQFIQNFMQEINKIQTNKKKKNIQQPTTSRKIRTKPTKFIIKQPQQDIRILN